MRGHGRAATGLVVAAVMVLSTAACDAHAVHVAAPLANNPVVVDQPTAPVVQPAPKPDRVQPLPPVTHVDGRRAISITFDDGPDPKWTPRVLRLLARAHVHATFCMIGRWAAAHPALVRRIVRAGHDLCDHTWDHDLDLRARPRPQIQLDMARGAAAISRATHGTAPVFFRVPGGRWSPFVETEAVREGMTPLGWSVDPRDWTRPGWRRIVRTVLEELRPGGVILMHDGGGNRWQSVRALRRLLWLLPKIGYRFVLPRPAVSQAPGA